MTESDDDDAMCSTVTEGRSLDAALHNVKEFGGWIANADTKSSIVGAALAVVLSGLGFQRNEVHLALEAGFQAPLVLGALALLVFAILATGVHLYLAITPRTGPRQRAELNRFAWPTMVEASVDHAVTSADYATLAQEAWGQSITLAGIADFKFRHLRKAMRRFGAVVVLYLFWLLVSGTV